MNFILRQWRELGPALFLATLIVATIQMAGSILSFYVLWCAWNSKPGPQVAFMAIVFAIANLMPFFIWAKPSPKPVGIPEEAFSVGNNYMKVWTSGGRIHLVFRNMPIAKISFDKRVAEELSQTLLILGKTDGSKTFDPERT